MPIHLGDGPQRTCVRTVRGWALIRKTSLLQDRSDGVRSSRRHMHPRHDRHRDASREMLGDSAPLVTLRHDVALGAISSSRCQTTAPSPASHSATPSDGRRFDSRERAFLHAALRSAHGEPSGGARRDRTDDLLLAKQALSQLSYGPSRDQASVVRHQTARVLMPDIRCLIPANWWAWEDLNFRPHAYQARALTN